MHNIFRTYVISEHGFSLDERTIKFVLEFPTLTNIKNIKSFLRGYIRSS